MKSCKTMSKKKFEKKSENPRLYGQNKLLYGQHVFQPLGIFSHVNAYTIGTPKKL
jgi:hypothetical protein